MSAIEEELIRATAATQAAMWAPMMGPMAAPLARAGVDAAVGAGGLAPEAVREPTVKEKFSTEAYASLGLDKETFDKMDPVDRNHLITAAYARMYASDPDTFKWAGMAAYASDAVGFGIRMAPGVDLAGLNGKELEESLAGGNAGIFEDVYWQHLAFQQGGIEAIEKAAKQGEIPADQLEGWRKIATARTMGPAGEDLLWQGNEALLRHEQLELAQPALYDKHRELYGDVSGTLTSPIPGGTAFQGKDISDPTQRWDWITKRMLPEWRERDKDRGTVMEDMSRFQHVELPEGGVPVWGG